MTDAAIGSLPIVVSEQNKVANAANRQRQLLAEIGVLGSTPRGFVSQGPLQPLKFALAQYANDILKAEVFDKKDVGDYVAWNKKIEELSAAAAEAGNQTALASLSKLSKIYPTPDQPAEGFAKNTAELMMQAQQEIDRARFFNDYNAVVRGQQTRTDGRLGSEALDLFNQKYADVYVRDRAALERMLNSADGPRDPGTGARLKDDRGREMSWFTFLQKNGGRIDEQFVKEIEGRFGAPGIMRYFQVRGS